MTRTNQHLVNDANELARTVYKTLGYIAREDFKFYESKHPQEIACWRISVAAYEHIEGSDVDAALEDILDDHG